MAGSTDAMTDPELDELRAAFEVEGAELLAEMESALLVLETRPDDVDEFNRLFRTVHTIKGSAGIVGCDPVQGFCHEVEHLLVRIRDGKAPLDHAQVSLLLSCHDRLRDMLGAATPADIDPPPGPEDDRLLARLADDEPVAREDTDPHREPGDSAAEAEVDERSSLELHSSQRFVRIEAERVDQLADLVTELVTATSTLEANLRCLGDSQCIESSTQVTNLVKQVQEKSMSFRMVPVKALFRRFQRIVHDDGERLGKQIRLLVSGGDTELDKAIVEKLHDPLLHLVRNAIDHGIESAVSRTLAGKTAHGTIHLQAAHVNGSVVITVSDDGRGLDLRAIANKAVRAGLVQQDAPQPQLVDCIFEPGFSTAETATRTSGRGVGLDVVRRSLQAIRGQIEVATDEGSGTRFVLRIPLSVTLVDGFLVTRQGSLFIVPLEHVQECFELPDLSRPGVMTNGCLQLRDRLLPCIDLADILGLPSQVGPNPAVVVLRSDDHLLGLVVDQVLGETKSIIKPLGALWKGATCVSGASILGDGAIALFLETEKLLAACSQRA